MCIRMMQYCRHSLSQNQQTPWICYAYRSANCKFSKLHGPVRYVPRIHRQTPAQRQDEQMDSHELDHPNDDEGKNKHVVKYPLKAQQAVSDRRLAGHLGRQQIADANARSGSCPNEREGTYGLSIDPSSSRKIISPNSSHNLYKEEERSTLISEEDRNRQPVYVKLQIDADCIDKSGRRLPRTSADWDMPTLRADVLQNKNAEDLDTMVKTREKGLGRAAFLHMSKGSTSLSIRGKSLKNGESDIQGRKAPPWQDAESFLLKVQLAKQNRSLEALQLRHTAATTHSVVDLIDDAADGDFTDDDTFMSFEQETPEDSEDGNTVGSHSTAEQERAKNQAIRYLSLRPYTAVQLRKKLIAQNIAPTLADDAVATLQSCGLQSDLAYAESFSYSRFNHGSWGPQRIQLGLKQRGIDDEIIKVALDKVFNEEEGNINQDGTLDESLTSSSIKMSKAAMDHLLVQATKHWNRGRNATIQTKTRRMVCWLQYRGFNYSIIKHVLNHLQRGILMKDEH